MKKNNRTHYRHHSGDRVYPLTSKLYCSCCNAMMIGISGYGRHGGKYYYYYHCKNRRNNPECMSKNIRAEEIEGTVIKALQNIVMSDANISKIALRVYEASKANRDTSLLDGLKNELAKTDEEIENILKAIKSGMISKILSDELSRLEDRRSELNYSITQEKAKTPDITVEQIEFMLHRFREEVQDKNYSDRLIDTFVNRIYYDGEQAVIWLNYTKNTDGVEPQTEELVLNGIKKARNRGSSIPCNVFVLNV